MNSHLNKNHDPQVYATQREITKLQPWQTWERRSASGGGGRERAIDMCEKKVIEVNDAYVASDHEEHGWHAWLAKRE